MRSRFAEMRSPDNAVKSLALFVTCLLCMMSLAQGSRTLNDTDTAHIVLPQQAEIPFPLVVRKRSLVDSSGTNDSPWHAVLVARGEDKRHLLTISLRHCGSNAEARKLLDDTQRGLPDLTAMVPIPTSLRLGEVGAMLAPAKLAAGKGGPRIAEGYSLEYVRGAYLVTIGYHNPSSEAAELAGGANWMDGDAYSAVWRIARSIDAKLVGNTRSLKRMAKKPKQTRRVGGQKSGGG